ncbi:hypothetical protein FRC00_014275, partial [Tulasnella sp. 408]
MSKPQRSSGTSQHPEIFSDKSNRQPDYATEDEDYDDEEEADETLLIPPSTYDTFVCGGCVLEIPAIKRWAGTPGCRIIVRTPGKATVTATSSKTVDFRGWEVLGEQIEGPSSDPAAAE